MQFVFPLIDILFPGAPRQNAATALRSSSRAIGGRVGLGVFLPVTGEQSHPLANLRYGKKIEGSKSPIV